MSDAFHWNVQLPLTKTSTGRPEECRWLATIGPKELRESYLELAAEYEQLASEPEPNESGLPSSIW
jgi:hypothetical protein